MSDLSLSDKYKVSPFDTHEIGGRFFLHTSKGVFHIDNVQLWNAIKKIQISKEKLVSPEILVGITEKAQLGILFGKSGLLEKISRSEVNADNLIIFTDSHEIEEVLRADFSSEFAIIDNVSDINVSTIGLIFLSDYRPSTMREQIYHLRGALGLVACYVLDRKFQIDAFYKHGCTPCHFCQLTTILENGEGRYFPEKNWKNTKRAISLDDLDISFNSPLSKIDQGLVAYLLSYHIKKIFSKYSRPLHHDVLHTWEAFDIDTLQRARGVAVHSPLCDCWKA